MGTYIVFNFLRSLRQWLKLWVRWGWETAFNLFPELEFHLSTSETLQNIWGAFLRLQSLPALFLLWQRYRARGVQNLRGTWRWSDLIAHIREKEGKVQSEPVTFPRSHKYQVAELETIQVSQFRPVQEKN